MSKLGRKIKIFGIVRMCDVLKLELGRLLSDAQKPKSKRISIDFVVKATMNGFGAAFAANNPHPF